MPLSLSLRPLARIGLAAIVLLAAAVPASAGPPIDIAVKNWSFSPAAIDAHVGQPTVLHFISTEGVHGVESAEIGLAKTTITPGKTTEVSFTPKTAGTFTVHCSIICGEGHDKMLFTVKVAP